MRLAKRVQSLKASPTLALAAKAKELKALGEDVISLSVGEPDWDTFESIKQAAIEAIRNGYTKYTPASGTPGLRQAIAEQTSADLGLDYSSSDVTVSSGGKFILFSALQSLVNPGDEVVIPSPYWVSYPTMVELAGGVPVIVPTQRENCFKMTVRDLKQALTSKTKILILNSPSNPTGEMYTESELADLAKVLLEHPDVLVISDDIYNRLVFNEVGLAPHILKMEPQLKSRTIVVNGVSKTYSMTGWRLGWALGPADVIGAMNKYQSQSTSCASSITQEAAIQAIKGGEGELKAVLRLLKDRRDFIYKAFSKMDGVIVTEPQGAFYIWPDISSFFGRTWKGKPILTSSDFSTALLEDQLVVSVPGLDFGMEGFLRISYAIEEPRMQEALDRIQLFISKLK